MTQQPIELTVDDMTQLIQTDETSRLKVQAIALQRRIAELEAENAELKAQIAEPDTTSTMRWLTSVTEATVRALVEPLSWPLSVISSVMVTVSVEAVIVVAI